MPLDVMVSVESPDLSVPGQVDPASPEPPELLPPELLPPELLPPLELLLIVASEPLSFDELLEPELPLELPAPELPLPELPAPELLEPELPAPELPELDWPELEPELLEVPELPAPELPLGPPPPSPALFDDVPHAAGQSSTTPAPITAHNDPIRGFVTFMAYLHDRPVASSCMMKEVQ